MAVAQPLNAILQRQNAAHLSFKLSLSAAKVLFKDRGQAEPASSVLSDRVGTYQFGLTSI